MAKKLNIDEATKSLALLAQEFPECFTLAMPQPLKVNIKKDIIENWGATPKFSKTKLQQALYVYTNSASYLNAFKAEPVRVDLDGNPAEDVLESDRDYAFKKYLRMYKKKTKDKKPLSSSERPEGRGMSPRPFAKKDDFHGQPYGSEKAAISSFVQPVQKADLSTVEIIKKPSRRKSPLLKKS